MGSPTGCPRSVIGESPVLDGQTSLLLRKGRVLPLLAYRSGYALQFYFDHEIYWEFALNQLALESPSCWCDILWIPFIVSSFVIPDPRNFTMALPHVLHNLSLVCLLNHQKSCLSHVSPATRPFPRRRCWFWMSQRTTWTAKVWERWSWPSRTTRAVCWSSPTTRTALRLDRMKKGAMK